MSKLLQSVNYQMFTVQITNQFTQRNVHTSTTGINSTQSKLHLDTPFFGRMKINIRNTNIKACYQEFSEA